MGELTVTVAAIRDEAIDVRSFELRPARGASLPPYAPGSHIDVHPAPGIVRQYSLCGDPRDAGRYLIAVKREAASRGGSAAMHERVREGQELTIGAPRNNFALVAGASHHLLVAGGIGITPLLGMARHLVATGESFQLLCFSRSIAHTAFRDLLSGDDYRGKVGFHYALEPDQVRAYLRKLLWIRPAGAHLYLCGPRPFMDLVEATAAPTWAPDAVHLEYFAADPASLSGPRPAFVVKLARHGGEFEVPEGRSIIEVLAENGVTVETSCEQGVCGTCVTGVLEGEPDHRDIFFTDAEKRANDRMTVCVSRAKGARLVLDL
ncbi:vanillate monooxygenase ferredoxin subunit [Burkholderiales bacterium]|nr:vanillate monooxygenase ferredoxin subunit [Burkholderiales bacterium]